MANTIAVPILNSTPIQVVISGRGPNCTVCLNSAAGGRLIQYQESSNRPDLLITVTPDVTTASQLIAVNNAPVYAVWLTGQAGDTYEIKS